MSIHANKHVDGGLMLSASFPHSSPHPVHSFVNNEASLSSSLTEERSAPRVLEPRLSRRLNQYPVPFSLVRTLATKLKGMHAFSGVSSIASNGVPFIAMTAVTTTGFTACGPNSEVWAAWQYATTTFGKVFHLSVSGGPHRRIGHAFIPADAALYNAFIRTGRLAFVVSHAGRISDAFLADFTDDRHRLDALHKDRSAPTSSDFWFDSPDLAYWLIMAHSPAEWHAQIAKRPQDTLQADWATWATVRAERFMALLSELKLQLAETPMPSYCAGQEFSTTYPHFFRLLKAVCESAPVNTLLILAGKTLESVEIADDMLRAAVVARQESDSAAVTIAIAAMKLSWYVHPAVHAGCRRPWFDRHGERVTPRFIDLDPTGLGNSARNYWRDLDLNWPIDHGRFLVGKDLPADIAGCKQMLCTLPLAAASVAETTALAQSILTEAKEHKQWTVPPLGAHVQLGMAAFPYVDVYEVATWYWCVLRDPANRYLVAMVDLEDGVINIPSALLPDESSTDAHAQADGAISVILASIIRDFIVTDRRELVFGRRTSGNKVNAARGQRSKQKITTYMPRVSFQSMGNIAKAVATFATFKPRAKHQVSGHVRRCDSPSAEQRLLALQDGIRLQLGYTYVRPHFRGDKSREQIQHDYRSQSANRLLFPELEQSYLDQYANGEMDWFQFERKAVSFTRSLKLIPQSVSAPPSGVSGLDICAYSQKSNDIFLIRFMMLAARQDVAANVVNDVIASLHRYPIGTKAMIVTTSGFTSDAVTIAKSLDVKLVDAAQLSSPSRKS